MPNNLDKAQAQNLKSALTALARGNVISAEMLIKTVLHESYLTPHSCNEGNGPYFGRLIPDSCPRCKELSQGAKVRDWINPRN